MAMKPCPCGNRGKNSWWYGFNDETRKITAKCKKCKKVVEFSAKPRKPLDPNKIEACAEYEIREGQHYLKIDGEFVKVGLCRVNKKSQLDAFGEYLRVMPI